MLCVSVAKDGFAIVLTGLDTKRRAPPHQQRLSRNVCFHQTKAKEFVARFHQPCFLAWSHRTIGHPDALQDGARRRQEYKPSHSHPFFRCNEGAHQHMCG
ncbi:hypothetical protein LMJF_27_1740 [Leishmania major strain Friedlin]|uniref:Uncharacterized protein n=1 Tax=Leishmania major TaxID=5664 RepID=E9ADF1_LEIMA|nr:hypothetical protein LMJF_27_1740 [Leishmania major strain Friedlin]CAG9576781.1 hypothetical_protein_-_unknown_function [Leishmania major strain Friedlin]CBZ12241.1 hypothetical protein LMJF_27_1740 [Leishmania major strain Friedlin]|eukprot:XP_003721980.1 hypothetical protein LMJF_27_1740 [Leishmania major strain Friedlin]